MGTASARARCTPCSARWKKSYVRSCRAYVKRRRRVVYRASPKGLRALAAAKDKAKELFGELVLK